MHCSFSFADQKPTQFSAAEQTIEGQQHLLHEAATLESPQQKTEEKQNKEATIIIYI